MGLWCMAPADAPLHFCFQAGGAKPIGGPSPDSVAAPAFVWFPIKKGFSPVPALPPLPRAQRAPEQRLWRTARQLPWLLGGSCSHSCCPFLLASPTVSNSEGKAWFVCPVTRRKGLQLGNDEARAGDCCVQRVHVGKERTGHLLLPAEAGESEGRGRKREAPKRLSCSLGAVQPPLLSRDSPVLLTGMVGLCWGNIP